MRFQLWMVKPGCFERLRYYPSYLVWKDTHFINAGPGGQGV
jgi:hypothetical protein